MSVQPNSPSVQRIDPAVVERLIARHTPHPEAVAQAVDIISDANRQDDEGYNWTRLRFARAVADVLPGSSVVIGSAIGRYPAKVIAWDFEVSDDDPIVTLELLA
jgi:Mg-chelatase subunit ChlI